MAAVQTALKNVQTPGKKKKKHQTPTKDVSNSYFYFIFRDKMPKVYLLIYSVDSQGVMFVLLGWCCEVKLKHFTHQSVVILYVYRLWDEND